MKQLYVFILLIPALCQAQVYKCTDAKGVIQYSQTPCNTNAEQIDIKTNAPNSGGLNLDSGIRHSERAWLNQRQALENRRRLQRQIDARQTRIDQIKADTDRNICERYKTAYDRANSYLADGYTRSEESIIRPYVDRYEAKIKQYCK